MSTIDFLADSALDEHLESLDRKRCVYCGDYFNIDTAIDDEENDKNIICPLCGNSMECF